MQELLSERIKNMAESATLAMFKQTQLLRSQGHSIYDLSIGEPDFATPHLIQDAAKEAIDSGKYFAYSPVAGYKDLREAIAHKLSTENHIPCTPEQIVVSTGAKQALANLFLCLLNPGDEVIIYTPYWVSYACMVQLAGGKPVFVQGSQERNFEPTSEQVAQAITPRTKAIIFSSPSNPNGLVLSQSSLLDLAQVLERHPQVLVIADEIYEYINFTDDFTSIGSIPSLQGRVVTVNGFSKSYAMTGWRVGYVAAPIWLAKACEKLQGQTTSGTCSISQRAALAAFNVPAEEIQGMREAYRHRIDLAMQHIQDMPGILCNKPLGAFYIFPDISHYFGYTDGQFTINNADDFCMYMLQEARVSMVAGTGFGIPTCVRISVATSDEVIQEAMERMQRALEKLRLMR
jgi:aspartate aminotransferase